MRKVNLHIAAAVCVLIMTLAGPALGDTHYVSPGQSIQAAIDDANDGDEIEVAPGTYNQTVDFKGKAVRLYSSGGPEVTIIDGRQQSYQDNFNDGNYDGWQIVDQGNYSTPSDWSAATGEMVQSSNIYTEPTSDPRLLGTYALCTQDLPWTNYEVTLSMKSLDDDWMGIMFRYVDPDNYYRFAWDGWYWDRRLDKMANGAVEHIWYDIYTYTVGQWYNVRIAVKSYNLKVFVDDILVFGVYDSSFISGPIALYCCGNEGTYFDNIEVNWQALHVVQCVSGEETNTILEGFTITGGNANGIGSDKHGGGMYNYQSNPTVMNCIFSGNRAGYGGGMLNDASRPIVTDCNFMDNTATSYGGGMENFNGSSAMVNNCTFIGNTATECGGGMINNDSSPTVTNCIFWNNSASYGGGMYNRQNSNPTVANCTFSGNSAPYLGGGMCNWSSSPTVTNCILWGNTPNGIFDDPNSASVVTYSDVQGGWPGVGNINAAPLFVDAANGNLRLEDWSVCVDAGKNDAVPADITDLDGDGNTVEQIPFDLGGNPRFVDDANITDTGSGTPPIVDIGAYERQSDSSPCPEPVYVYNRTQQVAYVNIQAAIDEANDGDQIEVSGRTFYESIDFVGKAIRLYSSGGPEVTTIYGTGHYHVVQCVSGEDANTILEGFTITGGNANGEPFHDYKCGGGMYNYHSSPTVTNCTFSGNSATQSGGGMYNGYDSGPMVVNCTFSQNTAGMDGGGMFNNQCQSSSPTVTNCIFSGNSALWGGAISNSNNSTPIISNCTFSGNKATSQGGGMYNISSSSPTVTNCTFSGNTANAYGGGMDNKTRSNPTVTNCLFIENTAQNSGGGLSNLNTSSPTVTNCTFSGNLASNGYGGGMYNYNNSKPTVSNCTFSDNNSSVGGGGVCNSTSSNPMITNCTFTGNTASSYGGGIYSYDSNPTVTNCILFGNISPTGAEISGGSPTVTYSDVQGGWGGAGNIDEDPYFVDVNNPDPNLWNLRLQPDSTCIDAGNTAAVTPGIFVDADGNIRGVDDPASPDTGVSVSGVTVDMGAYEFQICPIPGDINCDGVVDFKDVAIICANWLAGTEPEL